MKHTGVVDSEDGTLLIGDPSILHLWQGSDLLTESTIIQKVVEEGEPGCNILIQGEKCVLWNLDGQGTVDVYLNDDGLLLVRYWSEGGEAPDDQLCSVKLLNPVRLGDFKVESGFIALMWSGESGSIINEAEAVGFYLNEVEMMSASSGLIISVTKGNYECFQDQVNLDVAEARRCHIIRAQY